MIIKQNSAINAALYAQLKKGINAKWNYDNYKSGLDKAEEAITYLEQKLAELKQQNAKFQK